MFVFRKQKNLLFAGWWKEWNWNSWVRQCALHSFEHLLESYIKNFNQTQIRAPALLHRFRHSDDQWPTCSECKIERKITWTFLWHICFEDRLGPETHLGVAKRLDSFNRGWQDDKTVQAARVANRKIQSWNKDADSTPNWLAVGPWLGDNLHENLGQMVHFRWSRWHSANPFSGELLHLCQHPGFGMEGQEPVHRLNFPSLGLVLHLRQRWMPFYVEDWGFDSPLRRLPPRCQVLTEGHREWEIGLEDFLCGNRERVSVEDEGGNSS